MAEDHNQNAAGGRNTVNIVPGDDTGVGAIMGTPAGPIGTVAAAVAGRPVGNRLAEGTRADDNDAKDRFSSAGYGAPLNQTENDQQR